MFSIQKKSMICNLIFIMLATTATGSDPEPLKEARILQDEPIITGRVFVTTMQADGSPYLHDGWVKGDIVLDDGSVAKDQYLRYHGYLDELIWRQPRTLQSIKVDKEQVARFILYPNEQDTLVFENLTTSPWYESKELRFYAQILYEGDITLLAHQRIRRTGETHRSSGGRIISRPRIDLDPVYYFLMPDGEAMEIGRKSNRSISGLFPEYRREIRSVLRNEGIRVNNEDDLIEATRAINSLETDW